MAVPTTPAVQHHAYVSVDTSVYSDEELINLAIRPVQDVIRSLMTYYDGDLFQIQGNDYIPWNVTATRLNEVYGYFGWTPTEIYTREWEKDGHCGYETLLRLTVKARMPDGSILEKSIERAGVSEVIYTKSGELAQKAHDTALKACRSDALSVCAKSLGPQFGLFLYEKETTETSYGKSKQATTGQQATGLHVVQQNNPVAAAQQQQKTAYTPKPSSGGDKKYTSFTDKQRWRLRTNWNIDDEKIDQFDLDTHSTSDIMSAAIAKQDYKQFLGSNSDSPWEDSEDHPF